MALGKGCSILEDHPVLLGRNQILDCDKPCWLILPNRCGPLFGTCLVGGRLEYMYNCLEADTVTLLKGLMCSIEIGTPQPMGCLTCQIHSLIIYIIYIYIPRDSKCTKNSATSAKSAFTRNLP